MGCLSPGGSDQDRLGQAGLFSPCRQARIASTKDNKFGADNTEAPPCSFSLCLRQSYKNKSDIQPRTENAVIVHFRKSYGRICIIYNASSGIIGGFSLLRAAPLFLRLQSRGENEHRGRTDIRLKKTKGGSTIVYTVSTTTWIF